MALSLAKGAAISAVVATAFSSCVKRSYHSGQAKPNIVGADPDLPTLDIRIQSVGGVGIIKKDGNFSFCSSVLVAENLALTAAHCLEGAHEVVGMFFGANLGDSAAPVRAEAWAAHPKYVFKVLPHAADYDIAWVKLNGPLPPNVGPIAVEADLATLKPGANTTLVGFGTTSEWERGGDSKRRNVEMPILDILSNGKSLGEYSYNNVITLGVTPNRGACYGDSGGPLYVAREGSYRVAGVTHGVDVFPDVPANATDDIDICAVGKVAYVAVAPHVQWIEESSGIKLNSVAQPPVAPMAVAACGAGSAVTIESGGYCYRKDSDKLVGPFSKSFIDRCKTLAPNPGECVQPEISFATAKLVLNLSPFLSSNPPSDVLSDEDKATLKLRLEGFEHPSAKTLTQRSLGKVWVSYEDRTDPSSIKFCVAFDKDSKCRMRKSPDYGGTTGPEGQCQFSVQSDAWIMLTCRTVTGKPCNPNTEGPVEARVGHITGVKTETPIADFTGEENEIANKWGQSIKLEATCPL